MRPWLVVTPSRPGLFDGIGDYAGHLADALTQAGASTTLVTRPDIPSWRRLADLGSDQGQAPGIILQYFPQAYARLDFPSLLATLRDIRAAGRPVIVTAHELWVHQDGRIRRTIVHTVHRWMLRALLRHADWVVVTTPHAKAVLVEAGFVEAADVAVVPVGPNITPGGEVPKSRGPEVPKARGPEVPKARGPEVPKSTLVMFGQPAALHREALTALGRWMDDAGGSVRLVWLGRSPDDLRRHWISLGLRDTHVVFEGSRPADVLSASMASATLALAPYVDGASTRRSSLSSLIAHGLPLVGLDGPITDDVIRQSGAFALTPVDRAAQWTDDIAAVLADDRRRARMEDAARRLAADALAWPVIARRYLDLDAPLSRR